jgi:trimeric autotransporter adhesin
MNKIANFLLALCFCSSFAQFSKTHYIPPVSSSPNVFPEEQFLYISTPSLTPVSFRIINLGANVVNGTVSRDNPYIYNIGTGDMTQIIANRNMASEVMNNKGFIVEAEDLVYVSARIVAGNSNQAGALVSKGLAALGTQFRVGAFLNMLGANYDLVHYTFVSILATENNTTVSFSGIKPGVSLVNNEFAGNTPQPVVLNSGESYVLAVHGPTPANRDGLVGALISSDKPIAVNCGSFGGTNGEMSNLDLGFDQIVSAERTGKDYIFIRATGLNNVERVLLVAHEDETEVFLGNSTTPTATLAAGQYLALSGNQYGVNSNLYVRTSKNVFAYQSIGDDGRADQANQEMFFVPPLTCETPKIIDNIPRLDQIGARQFFGRVTIIAETAATLNFVIDGIPYTLANLPSGVLTTGPLPVTGNPNYQTYTITGLSGNVSVISSGQLYLASYGSSQAATFGGFYSGFTFKPEVAFDRIDLTAANCLPNVSLSVNPLTAFDIFQWYFNDNPIPGATTRNYVPTLPGYYYVSASIGACGTTLVSDKIPVSACATNVDGDLANDNIDIDNDNDGITNCMESFGNLQIPLNNPSGGVLSVGTYTNSFTGSFPAAQGTPAPVPFSGTNTGSFVTETTAGKGNTVIYSMQFATPVSISLDYPLTAANADRITSNAEFVVSVPVNKTLTVLNPNNQLLIDTNYDGIYESGVTQFSSFEIRFRLNGATPLQPGTGTFSFRAYLVSALTFTHRNLIDNANSRATFKVQATCVPRDSDGDGIIDQLDFDSDNDGIPDLVESQGNTVIALSNSDSNGDGLDDIFGAGIVPADTDGDGIYNYLDLDSDNDGIFDLVESGSGATDANNNGVADGSPAAFGSNGLLNSLETTPNSGTLNYQIADTDGDGILNYIELDSDDDGCSDTREAGFSDQNNDGYLGAAFPVPVNANGMVTGAGGYTTPNPLYIIPTPIIILQLPQQVTTCQGQNAVFSIQTNPEVTYQWQVATTGTNFVNISNGASYTGVTTSSLTVLNVTNAMSGYIYRVVLSRVGNVCGSISSAISLNINPLPASVTRSIVQCDSEFPADGITLFNLGEADALFTGGSTNFSVSYYVNSSDAQTQTQPLPLAYTNLTNPQQLVVRVTNITTGCFSYSFLNLQVNLIANQTLNVAPQCDTDGVEDGFFTFNLENAGLVLGPGQTVDYYTSETDALLEQNPIANPTAFVNLVPYDVNTVFARIENALGCSGITRIRLKVNPLPNIDTNPGLDINLVCVNQPGFTTILDAAILDGSNPAGYSYQWFLEGVMIPGATASTLTVSVEGLYSVVVTDVNGCSKTRMIPVAASSTAIIESIDIVDLSPWNTVTVNLASNSYGDYVYSLDYQNAFQTSNVFNNVPMGFHTVFVKDLNGCPVASQLIAVAGIPNFFTPNGDGFNDTWNIKGLDALTNGRAKVLIFDRYGKLIKQLSPIGTGWDGTYLGELMPATDYWYVITLEDGRTFRGHFALKR